jgi:indole-3-glycerol phosphate synthase
MQSVLQQIVSETRQRIAALDQPAYRAQLEKMAVSREPRGFRTHLLEVSQTGPAVIAELKKASPSRGVIREHFVVTELARDLALSGAAALSVLTEEKHFHGSLSNLRAASESVSIPCLRKDFIVGELQVLEARAYGGDALLLIVAALEDRELEKLGQAARQLGIDVLCEVHDQQELQRALDAGFDIVGVNNRDLRSFEVTLETSVRLNPRIPLTALRVAESGIHSGADIARLRAIGYQAFLIGESLMKQPSPGDALRKILAEATQNRRSAEVV